MRVWQVALPALLFVLLWLLVDVPAVSSRLAGVEPGWLVAGLLLVQAQVVLSALRWRFTAARLGVRIDVPRAIAEYYLATLLNQVLPGGVAGDAARTWRGARSGANGPTDEPSRGPPHGPPGEPPGGPSDRSAGEPSHGPSHGLVDVARGVVVERLAGQLSLVLVTFGGLAVWPWLLTGPPPRAALVALASVLGLALALPLLLFVSARFGAPRWRRAVHDILPTLRRCWFDDGAWLAQGVLSIAVTASYLGVFAIAASATGAPLPAAAVATIVPLTLASMLLPISVGGWGLREAAAAALWPLAGLTAEAGVAASVLYGLISLAGALPGLLATSRRP